MIIALIVLILVTISSIQGILIASDHTLPREPRQAAVCLTAITLAIAVAVFTVPALGVVS